MNHSCISSAGPGLPLPGPADYAPQGRSPGPDNRSAGLARPRKLGPKMGNGIRLIPPLQILSQPRPATAGPGGPRAARTLLSLLRAGHPALSRVPVTLHRSCTPELGTSCDVAVHSNIATRTAPDQLSRQETRIHRPGRTPPGPDMAQPAGSQTWASLHHPPRGRTTNPTKHPCGQSPVARTKVYWITAQSRDSDQEMNQLMNNKNRTFDGIGNAS